MSPLSPSSPPFALVATAAFHGSMVIFDAVIIWIQPPALTWFYCPRLSAAPISLYVVVPSYDFDLWAHDLGSRGAMCCRIRPSLI